MKYFQPIRVSSKFMTCGLPLTGDTYFDCSFGCKYCFALGRKDFGRKTEKQNIDIVWLRNKLKKIYDMKQVDSENFLENLLADKITWHIGGMADPFQHREKIEGATKSLVEVANQYGCSILFSTKSDDIYHWNSYNPDLHGFQLSITNLGGCQDVEPGVADIDKRFAFYHKLKDGGFKVGLRLQPFLPGVTGPEIIDKFSDMDYCTIEGLKLVSYNTEQKEWAMKRFNLKPEYFVLWGLLSLIPDYRFHIYQPTIKRLEELGIPFSISDKDMHHISSGKCCCGDSLIKKSTDFNNTAMFHLKKNYNLEEVNSNLGRYAQCKVAHLFFSHEQEGFETVRECINLKFDNKHSPSSKRFVFGLKSTPKFLDDFGVDV